MTNFLAMTRRELGLYFVSPVAYIILTALLFVSGAIFVSYLEECAALKLPANFVSTLTWMVWIVVITSALVTMRLIAEEKNKGTLEIILTAPVSDAQFVLSKFAAAMVLLAYLILPTVAYALIVSMYGQLDMGAVACGYLGVFLAGALAYSIGLFVSSLCSNQITAGLITFMISVLLFVLGLFAARAEEHSWVRGVVEYLDLNATFGDFLKGVVDLRRLVYLLSGIGFFLYLTTRVVQSRRWR